MASQAAGLRGAPEPGWPDRVSVPMPRWGGSAPSKPKPPTGSVSYGGAQRWMRRYVLAAVLADVVTAGIAGAGAQAVRFGTEIVPTIQGAVILFPVLWVTVVAFCGGYDSAELGTGSEEFRSLLRAGVVTMAAIGFVSYAAGWQLSRGLVVITVPTAVVGSAVGRHVLRRWVHRLRARGHWMRTVVAVGRERAVLDLVQQLRREQHCGMAVIGACVPDPAGAGLLRAAGVEVIGDLGQVGAAVRIRGADAVAVTSSSETAAAYLRRLSWELEDCDVELLVAPGMMEVAGPRMHVRPFIGLPLLRVEQPRFTGPKRLVKASLDRLAAALMILFLLPAFLVVGAAIAVDSRGPILFRQERIGHRARPFTMYKFRTMVVGAEARRAEVDAPESEFRRAAVQDRR